MPLDKLERFLLILGIVSVLTAVGYYIKGTYKTYDIDVAGAEDSADRIKVKITGEVVNPGEYSIPEKSRVCDVIYAAGGITQNADLRTVNLEAVVTDYMTVDIPAEGGISGGVPVININTADEKTIALIPQIGDKMAQRIVDYRRKNGAFASPEDITRVKGIGEKTYKIIKDYIKTEE